MPNAEPAGSLAVFHKSLSGDLGHTRALAHPAAGPRWCEHAVSVPSPSHHPMLLLRALPLLWGVPSFCRAFHARPFITAPHQRHPPLHMNMNNPEVPEKLRLANLKAHNEVWDSRRDMARATLSAAKAVRGARESFAGPGDASKDNLLEEGKGSLVISAIALAVAAATVRVGGRAALISVRMCWGDKRPYLLVQL